MLKTDHATNGSHASAFALEQDLRARMRGEVRFDAADRALYATDSSNYRQLPIGVVIPQDAADVMATFGIARKHGAPITARGGGTSLAGQGCNVAVIVDYSKYMKRVVAFDAPNRLISAEPGIVLDELQKVADKAGLIFGPSPATHSHCAIGGMIGNNSGGVHSVMAQFYGNGGRTSDNLESLDVLTYDGVRMRVGATSDEEYARVVREGGRRAEIYKALRALRDKYADLIRERYPRIPRRASGYNLDELLPEKGFNVARALAGSEGTCVAMLEATLQLIPNPPCRSLVMIGFTDIFAAADRVPDVLEHKPLSVEGMDDVLVMAMHTKKLHVMDLEMLPEGDGWLLVEFGGDTKEEAHAKSKKLMHALDGKQGTKEMKIFDDPKEEEAMWNVRDAGLGGSARIPQKPDTWEGWEDAAVAPERLGAYLREFRKLLDKFGYMGPLYGHFGQGVVHTRIDFRLKTHEGVQQYLAFTKEATELVVRHGGSLSGEHGDGQSRADLLPDMFGPELVAAFREFKTIWDPENRMNPGKIVDAYRRDENLRYGEHYDPPQLATHFKFPEDKGSFSYAAERCVGVGQCRRNEQGTMCPSYMVTKEEKHSTRGRARMLWEMLNGQVIGKRGWKDERVFESLDLCLSCKGCKADCPLNVDMATYKAEFLSHYYEGRLRPIHAYAFGLIHVWSRFAQLAPGLVNFVNRAPIISDFVKAVIGVAPKRRMPAFARKTFKAWFARRPVSNHGKPRVILWPDSFNNNFHPETLKAGVAVLENAGFQVVVPRADLCCGRPLYDYGMLDAAKRWLAQILRTLREEIQAGTPLVGLEPSCTAVFRDELIGLFPKDEDARRLNKQTFTLAEFLEKFAPDHQPAKLLRKAVVHRHCHQNSIMKFAADKKLLAKLGLEFEVLDSGCCGMAGAFGFEKEHYDVSIACGERVLLPRVRDSAKDTLVIADGFSCREQICQTTDRNAMHMAQVMQLAIESGPRGPAGNFPEVHAIAREAPIPSLGKPAALLAAGAALAILAGLALFKRRTR